MITDKRHAREGIAFAIRFRAVIETDLARVDEVGAAKRRGDRMTKNKRIRTRERGTDARVARRVGRAQMFRSPRNRPTRRRPLTDSCFVPTRRLRPSLPPPRSCSPPPRPLR